MGVLVDLGRDGRLDSTPAQIGAVGLGRVRLVGQHAVRASPRPAAVQAWRRDALQHRAELGTVATLSDGHHNRQRFLALLTSQMQLRGQPATRATQRVIGRLLDHSARWLGLQNPPFGAPVACWCARATVESTDTSHVIRPAASARTCNATRIRAHVPLRCHRRNSAATADHDPYRSGTSRHGVPARTRHRIPSISCRFVHCGGRPDLRATGSNGSSTAHCPSLRSNRPATGKVSTGSPVGYQVILRR
jgi:hypothetical protein